MTMSKKGEKENDKIDENITSDKVAIYVLSLRGIKDKNKQKELIENKIFEVEKYLKDLTKKLDNINNLLKEEKKEEMMQIFSKEEILKIAEEYK